MANTKRTTWHEALTIAKTLQEEYQLPIFAMTRRGNPKVDYYSPASVNPEAYLNENVDKRDWDNVEAWVVFKNDNLAGGEARFYSTVQTWRGEEQVPAPFGKVIKGSEWEDDQAEGFYVSYRLSENFTMTDLVTMLNRFVEQVNANSDEKWEVVPPESEEKCAVLRVVGTRYF